jgi:hypothetical protein
VCDYVGLLAKQEQIFALKCSIKAVFQQLLHNGMVIFIQFTDAQVHAQSSSVSLRTCLILQEWVYQNQQGEGRKSCYFAKQPARVIGNLLADLLWSKEHLYNQFSAYYMPHLKITF